MDNEFYDKYCWALDYINNECELNDENFRRGVLECLIAISESLNKIAKK